MSESKFIFKCDFCRETYCGNCSDADKYNEFCSEKCEKDSKEQKLKEDEK